MSDLDWRTVRAALEQADPEWSKLDNDAREPQWNFATKLLNTFWSQMSPKCINCQQIGSLFAFYRCWDCKAFLCEQCVKSHFGPNHTPHPKTVEQYEVQLTTLQSEIAEAREALVWKLIDEKAKDGKRYLFKGHWNEHAALHCQGQEFICIGAWSTYMSNGTGYHWIYEGFGGIAVTFTEYMPLPTASGQKDGGEG